MNAFSSQTLDSIGKLEVELKVQNQQQSLLSHVNYPLPNLPSFV